MAHICRGKTRKAKAQLELKRVIVGPDKKACFKYVNSKRWSKEHMGLLLDEDGPLAKRPAAKAEACNAFFASAFNSNDRPRAVRSSELEDHDCGKSDFPFVDTAVIRGQLLSAECS